MIEFKNLKRKNNDYVAEFSSKFNKMQQKILDCIKPSERLGKLTYANTFDADFCLLLWKRRSTTLLDVQNAALEVESNILVAHKLKGKMDRKKQREDAPSSSNSDLKMKKMAKMFESLTLEISKMKTKGKKQSGRGRDPHEFVPRNSNENPSRRNNQHVQFLQRDKNVIDDKKNQGTLSEHSDGRRT